MQKASIVSIGNEILTGRTIDTNAAYLSGKLLSIGIPVVSSYTIGDDIDLIVRALKLASDDADIVLATGGLGPTDDDLTRQAFAKFLGAELQMENELLQKVQNFFIKRNLKMPEKNKIQAYIPVGAEALSNNLGTAPGIKAKVKTKLLIAMPGVPSEMTQMFEESVMPVLKSRISDQAIVQIRLNCFGAGESYIVENLGNLMQRGRNPQINCTVHCGVVTLTILAEADTHSHAQQMAQKDEKLIREKLGKLIFSKGDKSLAEVVGRKLTERKKTLTVAESCTAGLLAKLVTDVPGSSNYFTAGWITYSNQAKISELKVGAELIGEYGAVSQQVAEAMAQGARKKARADFAIAVTGIAGPSGGTKQKPVGLVYICVDSAQAAHTQRIILPGNRNAIRTRAAQTALNILRLFLKKD
ncbi:MAG: competence/damage-inducible protein A [Sedimentisphaerales bacterium]|nr:competence/damage-inducible protein A [Sedimentisphaerales bacterium]